MVSGESAGISIQVNEDDVPVGIRTYLRLREVVVPGRPPQAPTLKTKPLCSIAAAAAAAAASVCVVVAVVVWLVC